MSSNRKGIFSYFFKSFLPF